MKVFGLCTLAVQNIFVTGKPQNIQHFYSDYFQDNNQDQQGQNDGLVVDQYAEYVDYGSGSGDISDRDIADSFMQQTYDIPTDIPVILLRQMLINSGYHEHMSKKKRRRRQLFYQDTLSSDYDYNQLPNYDRYVDYGNHNNIQMYPEDPEFSGDSNSVHFRGGIQQNFDINFDENSMDIDTIVSFVINHGCWCPKIEGHDHHEGKPLDEMDRACRDWSKCIHCSGLVGGCASSDEEKPETFKVVYTGSEYYCSDEENSSCGFDLCQCSLDWAVSLKSVIDFNNAKVPNEEYQNVAKDQCHVKRPRGDNFGGNKKKNRNSTDVFLTPDDENRQFRGQMDLIC